MKEIRKEENHPPKKGPRAIVSPRIKKKKLLGYAACEQNKVAKSCT